MASPPILDATRLSGSDRLSQAARAYVVEFLARAGDEGADLAGFQRRVAVGLDLAQTSHLQAAVAFLRAHKSDVTAGLPPGGTAVATADDWRMRGRSEQTPR